MNTCYVEAQSPTGADQGDDTPLETEKYSELHALSDEAVTNPTFANLRRRLEWLVREPSCVTNEMVMIRWRMYEHPEINRSMRKVYWVGQQWDMAGQVLDDDLGATSNWEQWFFGPGTTPATGPIAGNGLPTSCPTVRSTTCLTQPIGRSGRSPRNTTKS